MADPEAGQEPAGEEEAASQAAEQTAEEEAAQKAAEEQAKPDEGEGDEGTEKETPPSRRENKRISRLTEQLKARTPAPTAPAAPKEYKPIDYSKGEFTQEELEADRKAYAESARLDGRKEGEGSVAEQYKQDRFIDKLESDGERVAGKYPILDQESDQFNPDLTADVNEMFLAAAGYNSETGFVNNPNVRYRDFVEAFMDAVDRVADSKGATTAQNVARQASRTGVRPGGQSRRTAGPLKPGDISRMSSEEYEKRKPQIEAELARTLGN